MYFTVYTHPTQRTRNIFSSLCIKPRVKILNSSAILGGGQWPGPPLSRPPWFTLAIAIISRDNAHNAFHVSDKTSPNIHAQTVIIFALFDIYFCSSCKPDLLPPYQICFAFYNYTIIGACNHCCKIV